MIRQAEKRNLVADKSISLNGCKLFERICNIQAGDLTVADCLLFQCCNTEAVPGWDGYQKKGHAAAPHLIEMPPGRHIVRYSVNPVENILIHLDSKVFSDFVFQSGYASLITYYFDNNIKKVTNQI